MKEQKTKVPMETLEWMRVHFAPSTFHGRLQIGHRGKKQGVLPLFTCEREKMMDFVAHMDVYTGADYYITANMVSGVKRSMDQLFSLHNMVIDVDCHGEYPNELGRDVLIENFLWQSEQCVNMPAPTSVVMTGRGLQFWWALDPLHAKCKVYYDRVKRFFMEKLQEVCDEFSDFSVDSTASGNAVGYFRLPGTYNSKVNKMVKVKMNPEKPVYVLQDLEEHIKEEKGEFWDDKTHFSSDSVNSIQGKVYPNVGTKTWEKTKGDDLCEGAYSQEEVAMLKGFHRLGFFRLKQLIQLRHLRNRQIGKEERNNFNFMVYNVVCPDLGHQAAMEKMRLYNQGFHQPMSEQELMGTISSAIPKNGYHFTNSAIIDFFHVTKEEQEIIGLYPKGEREAFYKGNPCKTASRTLLKQDRDRKIVDLFLSKLSQHKIAEQVGVSHVTVSKVLRQVKLEQKNAFLQKVQTLVKENYTYTMIATTLQCSVSKISRCLQCN